MFLLINSTNQIYHSNHQPEQHTIYILQMMDQQFSISIKHQKKYN